MTPIDYWIIGIVVVSALMGALRGLFREVLTILTWLIALWAAWAYADIAIPYLGSGSLSQPPLQIWAARGLVFLGVMLLGTVITAVVAQFVRTSMFSGLDRFLGFLFGLLRGALIVGVLVMLAQRSGLDQQPWWSKSRLIPTAQVVAGVISSWVGDRIEVARERAKV